MFFRPKICFTPLLLTLLTTCLSRSKYYVIVYFIIFLFDVCLMSVFVLILISIILYQVSADELSLSPECKKSSYLLESQLKSMFLMDGRKIPSNQKEIEKYCT